MAQAQQARQSKSGPGRDRSVLVRSVQWRYRHRGPASSASWTRRGPRWDLGGGPVLRGAAPAGAARAGQSRHHCTTRATREAERGCGRRWRSRGTRSWTRTGLDAARARRRPRDMGSRHGARAAARVAGAAPRETRACRVRRGRTSSSARCIYGSAGSTSARRNCGRRAVDTPLARDPRGSAWTLTQLARALLLRGEAQERLRSWTRRLQRHRACEDARGEAWTLYYSGHAQEESGTSIRAATLERSRTMFSDAGRVRAGRGARHHSGGSPRSARGPYRQPP